MRSGIRYAAEFPRSVPRSDILAWCTENYGEPGFRARWMALDYTIQFKEEKDRFWFVARWG